MSNSVKKLKIKPIRIILIYVIAFLVLEAIFYLTLQDFKTNGFFPFSTNFYFYTPILVVLTIVFLVVSLTQTYYEIDKEKIVHHKMSKEFVYYYKDILYIDEEWSIKHKMLLFYDKDGKERILTFDREGLIFEEAVSRAKQISWEELKIRFPNIKL